MRLDELPIGVHAVIDKIEKSEIETRLFDLGFVPGVEIQCLVESPLQDPKMYRLLSTNIALRNKDAKLIQVRREER